VILLAWRWWTTPLRYAAVELLDLIDVFNGNGVSGGSGGDTTAVAAPTTATPPSNPKGAKAPRPTETHFEAVAQAAVSAAVPLTHASDAWAFGLLCHEVFADGSPAFSAQWDDHQVSTKVKAGFRPAISDGCPDALYELAAKCWEADPGSRPDFFWLRGDIEDKAVAARDAQTVAAP
jgi:hypothetical protein